MDEQQEEKWGAAEHVAVGAAIGGAGVGNSLGLIGISAGLAALPVCLVVGALGGLVWWGAKKIAGK